MDKWRLKEIRDRVEKAQSAPWKYSYEGRDHWGGNSIPVGWTPIEFKGEYAEESWYELDYTKENWDFLMAARQDVPDLLRYVHNLRRIIVPLYGIGPRAEGSSNYFRSSLEHSKLVTEILDDLVGDSLVRPKPNYIEEEPGGDVGDQAEDIEN